MVAKAEDLVTSTVERFRADLGFLASDELEGRDAGSEGIFKAGEYIASRFADLGLRTDSFEGSPFQNFSLQGSAKVGPAEQNYLQFQGLDQQPELVLGETFNPLNLGTEEGKFEGELVFAGYGITAAGLGYDDYAGVDVAGKVVIVLRKEPQQENENSVFNGKDNSQFAYFSAKEFNAANHKAAALIMVNDGLTVADGEDRILDVDGGGARVPGPRIPTFYCAREVIDTVLQQSVGTSLAQLEQEIDADLKPRSQPLGVIVSGEVKLAELPVRNVVGFLPGSGNLANQYVVVGAHYDHVGMGIRGSLARGIVAVHNGADDNASGTVAMLEVARRMTVSDAVNRRGIIFIAFTGEEKGLLGSKHYVRNPRWPLEETVAMVNMDMVGRLDENTLTVFGTGTATNFDALVNRLNQNESARFNLMTQTAGRGPSDHQSFYEKDIPVFHFFTGLHNDYHRPSDDIEKVNYEGMARIASMVTELVSELATSETRPQFTKTTGYADVGRSRARNGRPGQNSIQEDVPPRAVIGVVLNLDSPAPTISTVNPDGPADQSGIVPGDEILQVDAESVASIRDLQAAIAKRKPGEVVKLKVKRGEEELEIEVTLGNG